MRSWSSGVETSPSNPVQPGWPCSPEGADLPLSVFGPALEAPSVPHGLPNWERAEPRDTVDVETGATPPVDSPSLLTHQKHQQIPSSTLFPFSECRGGSAPCPQTHPTSFRGCWLRARTEELTAWLSKPTPGSSKDQLPSNK